DERGLRAGVAGPRPQREVGGRVTDVLTRGHGRPWYARRKAGDPGTVRGMPTTTRTWVYERSSGSMACMTVDRLSMHRVLAAGAGLLFGLLCVLLGPAAPASAHAALGASAPAAGQIVPDAPNRVTLTFSESVQLLPGKIQVLAPDGSRADQGEPPAGGDTVTIPLRSGGGRGTYLVSYRVISADSHPVAGSLTYSVGAASQPP